MIATTSRDIDSVRLERVRRVLASIPADVALRDIRLTDAPGSRVLVLPHGGGARLSVSRDAADRDDASLRGELAHELAHVIDPARAPLIRRALATVMALLIALAALPLADWMQVSVTQLEPHPNDPASDRPTGFTLPGPGLTPVYRLEAQLGQPLDLGDTAVGHRRIVPLTGGTFRGPQLGGTLVPGSSADWQTILPDGTALGDIRYTLKTDGGVVLEMRSRGVRHGSAEVLARLARGEDVDPSEYTFRTSTEIQTAVPGLDWLNKAVFIGIGGRGPAGVVYEVYLVG